MTLEDKAEAVVRKLLDATYDGTVKWKRRTDTHFLTAYTERKIDVVFTGVFRDAIFAVFKDRYQASYDGDEYFWTEDICVMLLDREDKIRWQFPKTKYTSDLFEAVNFKGSGVEETLDNILEIPF